MTETTAPPPARAAAPGWLDTRSVIAVMLVCSGVAVLGALFFVRIPAENQHQVDLVLGAILGAFTTAVTFYLGSSKSSAAKDDTISALANGGAP